MNIDAFLSSLNTSSKETLRAYRQELEKYQAFLRMKGLRVTQAKPITINEYVEFRKEHHGRLAGEFTTSATVGRWLSILSSYYDFLRDNSWGAIRNPVEIVKRPKVENDEPKAVEDHVLAALFEGITDKRDLAILLVFVYSGLRLNELAQLDKTTITARKHVLPNGQTEYYGEGQVVGKGRKRRTFIVGPKALRALRDYVREQRQQDGETALFTSNRDERISDRAIQHILNRWCKKLNLPHLHVHQLRHSFATRAVNAGMSAAVLQELMGHKNLKTTARYFRVKTERVKREYFGAMEFVNQTSAV